jgi:hypothetical protein
VTAPSPDQFLMGGGVKAARFEQVGDKVAGTIEDLEVRQQTDFDTGKPLTWDDGSPRNQLVVTLQTELRDDADDDGRRRVYVKGKSLTDATRDACLKVGARRGLEIGGWYEVAYVADGQPSRKGLAAPKLYLAEYQRLAQQVPQTPQGPAQNRQGQQIDAGPGWQGNQPAQPQYATGGPVGAPHQQVWQPVPAQQAGGWQRPTPEPPF